MQEEQNTNFNIPPRAEAVHIAEPVVPSEPAKKKFIPKLKFIKFNLSPNLKKFLIAVFGLLGFLLLLTIIASIFQNMNKGKTVEQPLATASPTPEETTFIPSPYADDEEVLSIEDKVMKLEGELELVDFRDETLLPPSLDWQVEF